MKPLKLFAFTSFAGLTLLTGMIATPATSTLRDQYATDPANWPAASWQDGVEQRELGLLPEVVHPEDNPYSKEKAELGERLFWDPRLSASGSIACVSCHHPDRGWSDGKTLAQGHQLQVGSRNAPTIQNSAFKTKLMWDGRADSLEDQALLPIVNPVEMHGGFEHVVERLNASEGYRKLFAEAFGDETADDSVITIDRVSKALATFQRTIIGGRSRFDAFLRGKHESLTDLEIEGLHLFRTQASCINCHNGPTFSDNQFHNVGLSYYGRKFEDLGRYIVTKDPADVGAFKTPTLRNITRTDPYMHNGLFELDGVINMYNAGGFHPQPREDQKNDPLFPKTSHLLNKLNLTEHQKDALIAFMGALEEPRLRVRGPELPD